jgi:hypothetical protein
MDFVEEKRTREEWEKGLPKRTLKDLVEAPKWFFSQEEQWALRNKHARCTCTLILTRLSL